MTNRYFTDAEIADFNRTGYLLVRGMIPAETIAAVRQECERVAAAAERPHSDVTQYYFEESLIEPGRRLLRRIERLNESSPSLAQLFDSEEIRGRVGELFGEPAVLFKDKLNLKLPGGGGFRMHRDGHWWWTDADGKRQKGWQVYGSRFITVYLSIDPGTLENGCLEVVPMEEARAAIGEEYEEITNEQAARLKLRPIETGIGDGLFFDARVPHASAPNRSRAPRQILYVTYNPRREGDHRLRYYADKARSAGTELQKAFG